MSAPREPSDWEALNFEASQVFSPGAPIDEQDLFAGRAQQVRALIDAVYQRGQHAIVFGERGVGKTSLANTFSKFMHTPTSSIIVTRTNCDGVDTFGKLWRKAFADWQGVELTEEPSPDDIRRTLARVAVATLPVMIFDEFDRLPHNGMTVLFADTIKALSDHSINATIVVVGVADSVGNLIREHASIARSLVEISMPRMSDLELAEIIDKRLARLGMIIDPAVRQAIVRYSQGLPHYTHLLGLHSCRAAIDARRRTIAHMDLTASIRTCLDRAQQSVRDLYHRATSSPRPDSLYRQVLLACALAETDELGFFAPSDVVGPMSLIMGRHYGIPSFARHLKEFCEPARGTILEQRGGKRKFRYRFTDTLMQPYITMQGVAAGMIAFPDSPTANQG